MIRAMGRWAAPFGVILAVSAPAGAGGDEPRTVAARAMAITEAALEHHVDPPTRQEMVLAGLRALYAEAGTPAPDHLARRVSGAATPDRLATLVAELWPDEEPSGASRDALGEAFIAGVLGAIPGNGYLMTDSERDAHEQFAGNRYVGLHIALTHDEDEGLPRLHDVFEGGPADRAGLEAGDLIERIDGEPMRGVALRDAVERLRGAEGSLVSLVVRQRGGDDPRELEVRREAMPRDSVTGAEKGPARPADLPPEIAYLKVEDLTGSTLHELRKHEARLRAGDQEALVLDLRGTRGTDPHYAVLVADGLLDEGPIGRERTAGGVRVYRSDPDCLFRDWPMAALIDSRTSGSAAWLAAALNDRDRAMLVGTPTGLNNTVDRPVPLPDGEGWLLLRTGLLERIGGMPMRSRGPWPGGTPPGMNPQRSRRGSSSWIARGILVAQGIRPDHFVREPSGSADSDPALAEAVEVLLEHLKTR